MKNADALVIKTLAVRNRNFTVIYKDNFYMAIEDKYITDGKMNTTLNGLQAYASKELNICINSVTKAVEMDYLMENGMSRAEAFCKVINIPLTEQLREYFENNF